MEQETYLVLHDYEDWEVNALIEMYFELFSLLRSGTQSLPARPVH